MAWQYIERTTTVQLTVIISILILKYKNSVKNR